MAKRQSIATTATVVAATFAAITTTVAERIKIKDFQIKSD